MMQDEDDVISKLNDGSLPAHVENYNRDNKDFPNRSTADQFYNTEEFEAYRALGEHIAKQAYPILYEILECQGYLVPNGFC
ncbi:MAG: hypothetical protein MUF71_09080 [Candidatus Kapabacteria bacterium]|jgi:hypothetical protein|nr:hypothetical protein [Candidatus Kapabacteria bacterium]